MKTTRILLCNHHPIIRNGLRSLLEREPAFRVMGEAANGREAVMLAEYIHPEIVLLDVTLPGTNGIISAQEISSKDRNVGIIFVTVHADEVYVVQAFKAGARGYVLADSAQNDLVRAIRVVAKGNRFLSATITSQVLDDFGRKVGRNHGQISEREKQLLCLIAEGYEDHEIARQLDMNVNSVRSDCQNVRTTVVQSDAPELIMNFARSLVANDVLRD
jgi:DNA-binding NarL/FixJ family response regulator